LTDTADIVIIGAGAAGLAAMRILLAAGLRVILLEARQRPGGRIHTIHDPLSPVPIELGPEFIHGKPPEIWRLVEAGKLAAVEQSGDHEQLEDGHTAPGADWSGMEQLMQALAGAPEQSFLQFLETYGPDDDLRRQAIGYVEGFNAARAEKISTQSLSAQDTAADRIEGGRAFRLLGGYQSLVDWLWSGASVDHLQAQFGAVVKNVRWRRGAVEIEAQVAGAARTYSAPRVIVTVPLGVLQAGTPCFDPQPDNLAQALRSIEMGHAARITFRFRQPVCGLTAGFLHSDADWMPVWWTTHPVHTNLLTGWTGGARAEVCMDREPSAWVEGAIASLARMLGRDANGLADELESWHAHNWSLDPFARGAYSYVGVGGMDAQKRFGEPVEDTLYFAGEAVNAEGHAATVHGAMATGERAAEMILAGRP
jgi:monoamine oxidase